MTARAHIRPLVLRGQACAGTPWLGVVAAAPAGGRIYPPAGGTNESGPVAG